MRKVNIGKEGGVFNKDSLHPKDKQILCPLGASNRYCHADCAGFYTACGAVYCAFMLREIPIGELVKE